MTLEHAPTLIGLTGPNGAGKDTVAQTLSTMLQTTGCRTAVLAFADALYEEVSAAFFLNPLHLKDRATKEHPLQQLSLTYCGDQQFAQVVQQQTGCTAYTPHSPRQILQWWGTEYRRAQQPDYWVQRLLAKVQQHREAGVQHIIVTDVRFADEAAAIRAQGGQIWRIHRPNYTPAGTGHVSEVTGEEFAPEFTFRNSGPLELLPFSLYCALGSAYIEILHKEAQWQSSKH